MDLELYWKMAQVGKRYHEVKMSAPTKWIYIDVLDFLVKNSRRSCQIERERDWTQFKSSSVCKEWVYLYLWSKQPEIFCWGTLSNGSDRIRKSSVFNSKLTGKYDRRVDYLMLKVLYGQPTTFVFEVDGSARVLESTICTNLSQRHCYSGLMGRDRREISELLITQFQQSDHFKNLTNEDQASFNEYLNTVFLAGVKYKGTSGKVRSFNFGDSVEPNFLEKIGKKHLEPAIEKALKVRF